MLCVATIVPYAAESAAVRRCTEDIVWERTCSHFIQRGHSCETMYEEFKCCLDCDDCGQDDTLCDYPPPSPQPRSPPLPPPRPPPPPATPPPSPPSPPPPSLPSPPSSAPPLSPSPPAAQSPLAPTATLAVGIGGPTPSPAMHTRMHICMCMLYYAHTCSES